MKESINLIPLDVNQSESFLKLYQEVFPQQKITQEKIDAILANNKAHVFLAQRRGGSRPARDSETKHIGFIYYWIVVSELQIMDIGVQGSHRRQGIAQALLTFAIKQAEQQGLKIHLEVRRDNLAAIAMYEKAGFIKIASRKKYYTDGCDALLYSMDLNQVD
jgi:ribosomal-protein-alanine acetyltransferase